MKEETRFGFRIATWNELDTLRDMIELSIRGLQKNDYTASQIEGALGHALGLDTQLVKDGTYFVAFPAADPEQIAGCGGWSFRRTLLGSDHGPNRESQLLDPAVDAAKIRAIFVHPKWARQGLGALILEHCENAARSAGFQAFEMGSTLTGVPLYSLHGYVKHEEFAIPLPNGEALPIVHMVKKATVSVSGA